MKLVFRAPMILAFALMLALGALLPAAAQGDDTLVTVGSPPSPFPQNKQNEPGLAIDAHNPMVLAAGSNDEIDLAPCGTAQATATSPCPFTTGVGVSGIYFSFDGGTTWTQPTYSGWSARTGVPRRGPIGTLPWYYENGLVSDGDPSLTFGPRMGANGKFSWANGSRLYYANLSSNFSAVRSEEAFKGFEAIAVSRTDNPQAAAANDMNAWMAPVIVSRQNAALFSDKEDIWADNAASSPFFGYVYLCNVAFRGQEKSPNAAPEPVMFTRSTDGGTTWSGQKQLTAATNNAQTGGRQGCAVRTDSRGIVYVFWSGTAIQGRQSVMFMARSFDGGKSFERGRPVANVNPVGLFDPASRDVTFDGVAGARTDSFPSVDIANGAPGGTDATDEIVMTWADGPTPADTNPGPNEKALVQYSTNRGQTWSKPTNAAPPSDRPDFPAIAISPNGKDVYLTYDNFLQPWQHSALSPPRLMQGVVRHADVAPGGAIGAFDDLHRGATGDARGSSANNLTGEFLGDYNYAAATRTSGVAVWNDVRRASDCPAVDAYRQSLLTSNPLPKPLPTTSCPPTFGNSDIFGGSYPDPTP